MKIAVYSIALNEEHNIEAWAESAKDADVLVLLDTGSTDNTVAKAEALGIKVHSMKFDKWRFDTARNEALALVPTDIDYCVSLDLDERLQPGWRRGVEDAQRRGINRPRYKYVWSWNDDGSEGLVFGRDHVHTRHEFTWRSPVHEYLTPRGGAVEHSDWIDMEVHHHPDPMKSRGQYYPLLQQAVYEDPSNARNTFYLAREHLHNGNITEAEYEFNRYLKLEDANWAPERSRAMLYLADIRSTFGDTAAAEGWLLQAAGVSPDRREAWVALAKFYHDQENWFMCHGMATRALKIHEKPLEYLNEPWAWGSEPWDYAAVSAYRLGLTKKAYLYGAMALSERPSDQRLRDNLKFYADDVEFST